MKVVIDRCPNGSVTLSQAAIERLLELGMLPDELFFKRPSGIEVQCWDNMLECRTDWRLVRVIEELGYKANGSYTDFKVVEIPDDVEWELELDADGCEEIHEVRRVWK